MAGTIEHLQLPEPLSVKDYEEVDNDISAKEELSQCWEKDLCAEFCAQKSSQSQETEEEGVEDEATVSEPAIKTFSQAMSSTNDLEFAAEKGLDSVLSGLVNAESELQQAFMHVKTSGQQTKLDKYFTSV